VISLSSFLDLTPAVQIVIENPIDDRIYPSRNGSATAIIDTGYEGFLLVPTWVFRELKLNRRRSERRSLDLGNGSLTRTQGTYAVLRIPHLSLEIDGFVETFRGLNEIIVGTEALMGVNLLLDYCTKRVRIEKCPNPVSS
jgi:clan AA aspartic protease